MKEVCSNVLDPFTERQWPDLLHPMELDLNLKNFQWPFPQEPFEMLKIFWSFPSFTENYKTPFREFMKTYIIYIRQDDTLTFLNQICF